MRIAYLVNQYPMPSQTFIRREIQALETLGHSVDRFTLRPPGELVDRRDIDETARTRAVLGAGAPRRLAGALLRTLRTRPTAFLTTLVAALRLGLRSQRGVAYHLAYFAEACTLLEWLTEDGADHVHAHFGTNGPIVALLVRRLGGPGYSFTVHGPEEFDRPETLKLREKVHEAAFVIAISSFGRSQLYRWIDRADWSKVHVVRCGLESSLFGSGPVPVPARPTLVCIGRLTEQKGQLLLVEAAARLLDEGVELELVLGGDGPMRADVEAAIERHGASGHIRITGWIDNDRVRSEIEGSRAMVLPSFAEGLPVAIMEALAYGRPVITTTVAGIPELVDRSCGWTVPAGSVDALATAMREALAASPEELGRMGQVGRGRVQERHDALQEATRLARILEDTQR